MTRSQKRQRLRLISEQGIQAVLKGIPRKNRRELSRIYASSAYRVIHNLRRFRDHSDSIVHPGVLKWIVEAYEG